MLYKLENMEYFKIKAPVASLFNSQRNGFPNPDSIVRTFRHQDQGTASFLAFTVIVYALLTHINDFIGFAVETREI